MQYSEFINNFLTKFETIRSFAKRIEFANTYLNRIGSGSGRIVYDIDGTKVFKIAKNSKGIAQNEIESSIGRDYMAEHIVTEVFESADDNSWLIAEKGKKVNERRIKELTDISSLVNLGNYLYNSTVYNSRFKRPVSDDVLENLKNNEFVIDLLEFVYNFGQSIGDMSRPSSYGEVVRDGQPMIVLTDYGLNDEVYQTHYSGQRKNRVYELYNFGDGNDDILSDIGGGEDIRKGMWAIIPYSVSDGDAVINEKIIKFITENTDFTNKINGAVVDSFHYVVENIKEYLNKSKNKKQFYENLLNMQEILINNGLYDRDRLEKINDGNVLGENIMTSGFTRKISDKIALDIVKNKGYDVLGYIGKGKHGYAYEITGGKILKITTDESEAKQSYKIKNLTLNTIVNIFDVFKINIGKDNKLIVFGIVLEKLKTDPNYFRKMYERLSSITKKIFKKDIYDILDIYRIFKDYYLESIKDRLNSYLSKYPEDAKFFNSLLKICDDLKKLNIDTTEYYSIHNLGFKPNGSLAVFDIGFGAIDFETSMETVFVNEFGGDSLYSTRNSIGNDNLPTYNNDNIVNERKLTFMKNSSSVNVKKKCKLGGLGNTSAACNQGDINNLEIKSINEEIDASEAHTDNGVLNAIANGKKNVGIIALKNKPHIKKIVSDLGLNLLPVKQLKHDIGMTIIYTNAGKEDAKKLYDFMISKGGYAKDETPEEAYFLGKIFGYTDESIKRYVECSIKRGRYKKELVNEIKKKAPLTYTGESFYFDPTKIKDNQWIRLTKILTKMGWADRPYTDWKNFFLSQGSQTIPGDYLDTDNENDLSKIIAIKKIITPKEKPTEEKSYITKAKRYFGVTNEYIFGGYILLDGTMLDFSGRKWGSQ